MVIQQKNKKSAMNIALIIKYFILWAVFALISYGMKILVLTAFEASPTGKVGNGFLTLYEIHNTGAAFNLFADQQEMIIGASFIAIVVLTFFAAFASGKLNQASISAMSALSAGITMNMYERVNQGYVIDYIHCVFIQNFPMFNVSDVFIVVGAICLIFSLFSKK